MLTTGQKCILELARGHGSGISKLRLTKLLFLISREAGVYDFVPYHHGPFSFQMYHDLAGLKGKGLVAEDDVAVRLLRKDFPPPPGPLLSILNRQSSKTKGLTDGQLLERIYSDHPWFTIMSLNDRRMDYSRNSKGITTIGYEGRSIDGFLDELLRQRVDILVDVRNNPFSFKFGFNKSILGDYLSRLGLEYVHMPEMGIASSDRKKATTEQATHELFEAYRRSLDGLGASFARIIEMGAGRKIALMCMEKDVRQCHRGEIARRLREMGLEVVDL